MTDTVADAPEGGALTVDQAVAGLLAVELVQDAPPEPSDAAPEPEEVEEQPAESEAEPTAEEDPAPEEPAGEVEEGATEEPAQPAVQPPPFWDDAAKAKFAQLPPELQSVALDQWKAGERTTNKALEEAATIRKQAEAEIAQVKAVATQLQEFLPKAVETFQSRWGNQPVDWVQVAEQYGTEQATKLKFQHDNDMAQLQRLDTARQQAATVARQTELREQAEQLKTIAPHLADPKEGPARRQALAGWLVDNGATAPMLERITPVEIAIAWKAYQADQAEKAAATIAAKPPAPKSPAQKPAPAKPVVKPTAATSQPSSGSRRIEQLEAQLAKTGDPDVAVKLLLARQGIY